MMDGATTQKRCSLPQIPEQGTGPSRSELICWHTMEASSIREPTGVSRLITWRGAGGFQPENRSKSPKEAASSLNQERGKGEARMMNEEADLIPYKFLVLPWDRYSCSPLQPPLPPLNFKLQWLNDLWFHPTPSCAWLLRLLKLFPPPGMPSFSHFSSAGWLPPTPEDTAQVVSLLGNLPWPPAHAWSPLLYFPKHRTPTKLSTCITVVCGWMSYEWMSAQANQRVLIFVSQCLAHIQHQCKLVGLMLMEGEGMM